MRSWYCFKKYYADNDEIEIWESTDGAKGLNRNVVQFGKNRGGDNFEVFVDAETEPEAVKIASDLFDEFLKYNAKYLPIEPPDA